MPETLRVAPAPARSGNSWRRRIPRVAGTRAAAAQGPGLAAASLVALLLAAGAARAVPDAVYYDGEAGSAPLLAPSCLAYATETTEAAFSGTNALKLQPDPWHRPRLNLYCGGRSRQNVGLYDTLEFRVRAVNPSAVPSDPRLKLTRWDRSSPDVSLLPYVQGGVIDGQWRLVSIPVADLKTADWDLADVEMLQWNLDSLSRGLYIDDIAARDTTAVAVTGVTLESDRALRVHFSERYELTSVRSRAAFRVSSATDPAYADSREAVDVGLEWRTVDFAGGFPSGRSGAPVIRFDAILTLPSPLQPGDDYTLAVDGVRDLAGNTMAPAAIAIAFDPEAANPNVKVNQVGYLADGPKRGFVGGWLGDLGGGVWAVGDAGQVLHWHPQDGWDVQQVADATLRGVAAIHEDDVWAVGDGGTVMHFDGTAWTPVDVPASEDLQAIVFTPRLAGWIVGSSGVILHRDGPDAPWSRVASGTTRTLRGVFASEEQRAHAVGDGGTILDWDGTRWTATTGLTSADLRAAGAFPGAGIFAVGDGGIVLERVYGHWQVRAAQGSASLRGMAGDANGSLVMVGDGGTVRRRSGFGDNTYEADAPASSDNLQAVGRLDRRRMFAFGPAGTAWSWNYATSSWTTVAVPSTAAMHAASAVPAGALRIEATEAVVEDASTGSPVMSVPLQLRAANWHLSGEDVYDFDFSELRTQGTYRVRVPGLGTSDPFVVSDHAYDDAARIAARGLYQQRCGMDLVGTTHPHKACHLAPAAYHASVSSSPLNGGEVAGATRDVSGGWHDAGDYNKYLPTAATALWNLITAYDLGSCTGPTHRDDWGLPESGNGVPDLLDEARWELEWLLRLQEADGGFANKVTNLCWFSGMPETSTAPQVITAKTTHDTASAAAVLASAARVFADWDPAFAASCLGAARHAWDFLELHPGATPAAGFTNPSDICTGQYQDPLGDDDERAWAAAELYRTTGEESFHDAFATYWPIHSPRWGWNSWQHHQVPASWAYANTHHPGVDEQWRAKIVADWQSDADTLMARMDASPYRSASRVDVPVWIGWGSFAQSTAYTMTLLQAAALGGDAGLRSAALENLGTQLGANPQSMSYLTGVGSRSPRDPLQIPSMYDGIVDPAPGIPVFGPMMSLGYSNSFYAAVQLDENSYPPARDEFDPYPALRRYIDSNELVPYSEFTVLEMGFTAGALLAATAEEPACTGVAGPCAALQKPRLLFPMAGEADARTPFRLGGEFAAGDGVPSTLHPSATGVRLFVRDPSGAVVLEAAVPPGTRSPSTGRGWSMTAAGAAGPWTATWAAGSSTGGGISRVALRWGSSDRPGRIMVRITGSGPSLAVDAARGPFSVELRTDTADAPTRQCGVADFNAAGSCRVVGAGVLCR